MDFIVNVVGQIYIDDSNILQSILNKIAFPNYLFSDNLINSILFIYLTIKVFLSNFFSMWSVASFISRYARHGYVGCSEASG